MLKWQFANDNICVETRPLKSVAFFIKLFANDNICVETMPAFMDAKNLQRFANDNICVETVYRFYYTYSFVRVC